MLYNLETAKIDSTDDMPMGAGKIDPSKDIMGEILSEYASLVRYVAERVFSKLPANVMLDDLISAGMIGLMDAANKYDSARNNKFKTYAEHRIRGEIIDEIRTMDTLSRSMRNVVNHVEKVALDIEHKLMREASDEEIATALGIPIEQYRDHEGKFRSISMLSLDEMSAQTKGERFLRSDVFHTADVDDPSYIVQQKMLRESLTIHMKCLPKIQREVVTKYYFEDKSFKIIGEELDLTESRVSQLHGAAIKKLQKTIPQQIA